MLSCVRLVPIRTRILVKVMNTSLTHSVLSTPTSSRAFSVLSGPPPSYDGYIPLTRIERGALALGSALGAVVNPRRAGTFLQASLSYTIADFELIDLVAALGEVTAGPFIEYLRDTMLLNETGRRTLRDRPRIASKTMPVEELRRLPENTVEGVRVC